MGQDPLIRPATPADLPAILDRWRELMATHDAINPALYALAPHGEATYRAFVRRQIDQRSGVVLVAPDDGPALAGYLVGALGARAPMFRVHAVGMIHDLAVRADRRRRGIARALVEGAFAHFRRHGVEQVQVEYDAQNPAAKGFWTSLGFGPLLTSAYRPL